MINPDDFINALVARGLTFFSGVPDSLLKELCLTLGARHELSHFTASNEGAATGMAIGHHLATGQIPVVYLQNSGLGNVVNPVCSLASSDVYGIPMLFIIGWRGEMLPEGTQRHDEPQHVMQGRVTLAQLDVLDIPYLVLDGDHPLPFEALDKLLAQSRQCQHPVALVIRKNTFAASGLKQSAPDSTLPLREEAVNACLDVLPSDVPIVSTTGMLSRELYELREQRNEGHARDFLTVGGMGLASQIALGIGHSRLGHRVVCLDGDGAVLMHMGGLTNAARVDELVHVVINNGAHESVGGQPTAAGQLTLAEIARTSGYPSVATVDSLTELKAVLQQALTEEGSHFIEVRCRTGHRSALGRPATTPVQNRDGFMAFLTERHGA
ncbi:phosphonopyruvate decarboxylase [Zymobacter palmae]|uniref:Thiaminepyrophosphate-requiring enzymes n=1 Tax=Zymobacter palmae TaxID=33074 RepID=A0A348HFJ3_9GAMM|nr:phosphonopyruvate decarboxylase [Zymobacter palmae]BBG30395.1 thiaminepyrophosphate-requiring enzymes [Zymobacter palmae]